MSCCWRGGGPLFPGGGAVALEKPSDTRAVSFQQISDDRSGGGLNGAAPLLENLEAGISRHVDIQDDDVRFLFRDFFYRGSAVADSHDYIPGLSKDFLAHVLGGHAVIGKQDS